MLDLHPSTKIIDSTKIRTFQDCPRKFFFEYVLGWRGEGVNVHLVFGSAVHKAMEQLLRNAYSDICSAYDAFLLEYRKDISEDMDALFYPKAPASVPTLLAEYVKRYKYEDNFDVLHTEVVATLPVGVDKSGERRIVYVKLDALLKGKKGYFDRDFKTAGKENLKEDDWYPLSTQMNLYHLFLNAYYPPEKVYGVEVDKLIVKKTGVDFTRIPVRKSPDMQEAFVTDLNHHLDMLDWNFEMLAEAKDTDPSLKAFPRNTESCTKYFGCPYLDFCKVWPNPLRKADTVQPGFKVSYWDPREQESEATEVIHIGE